MIWISIGVLNGKQVHLQGLHCHLKEYIHGLTCYETRWYS